MKSTICHYGHSTLTLMTEKTFFIFDWYQGDISFPKDKKVVLLATHGHGDHFDPMIFEKAPQDAIFILSDDIEKKREGVHWIRPDENYEIEDFTIHTFGSTDRGVSLILTVEGLHFYFAGDLNAWIWEEDDEETQEKERNDYLRELEKIKKYPIDIACVPVDPRLKEHEFDGMRIFMDHVQPKHVVPLHFQQNFEYLEHVLKENPEIPVVEFEEKGECVELQ